MTQVRLSKASEPKSSRPQGGALTSLAPLELSSNQSYCFSGAVFSSIVVIVSSLQHQADSLGLERVAEDGHTDGLTVEQKQSGERKSRHLGMKRLLEMSQLHAVRQCGLSIGREEDEVGLSAS